jgi:PAS domain S-box-containing protein
MMLDTARTEKNYLKQILDNSPDGMFTINAELDIQYVNPAFCRLLGYEADELLGTQITTYLGDLDILAACMVEVSEHGHCNDQETIFKRKDGSVVHISKNVQAISDEQGNFKEILVSVRDLTDLHRLNSELEESKRQLEASNHDLELMIEDLENTHKQLLESEKLASLGSLVAGVAHEINTPLGISITSSTVMHEEVDLLHKKFNNDSLKRSELEAFFEQADEACKILQTNLNRASDLVRSFKQVAVDQTVDDLRKIDLKEYLDETLLSIGPSFKYSKVSVASECEDDIEIETHPGALSQIISNLAINSMTHAYDENSEGTILIKSYLDGGSIVIEYADDGKGISQENLKHIFTPFFTTRRGMGGSGLGLSIVYNLVTGTLKGNITAESAEGKGTKFRIEFPQKA